MQTCREGKLSNWQSLTVITRVVMPVIELHHLYSGHMGHDQSLLLYRLFWLKANSQKLDVGRLNVVLRPCRAGVMSRRIEKSWDFKERFRRIEFTQKVSKTQEKELHHVKLDKICY